MPKGFKGFQKGDKIRLGSNGWNKGMKGYRNSGSFEVGHKINLGKHHSEEARRKIGEASKGRKASLETRKRMSEVQKGKKRSIETRRKISEVLKGKRTGKRNNLWKGGRIEKICRICEKLFYVDNCRKDLAVVCSHKCNGVWTKLQQKNKETKIEKMIEWELLARNIPYDKQVPISVAHTIVDFLLPDKIIVYCDGDYWHSFPERKIRDTKQNLILASLGYKVFRFSEKDIKKSASKCMDKIFNLEEI